MDLFDGSWDDQWQTIALGTGLMVVGLFIAMPAWRKWRALERRLGYGSRDALGLAEAGHSNGSAYADARSDVGGDGQRWRA